MTVLAPIQVHAQEDSKARRERKERRCCLPTGVKQLGTRERKVRRETLVRRVSMALRGRTVERGPSVWSAPRDRRVHRGWWVLRVWLGSRGSRDYQARQELDSQAHQALPVSQAVQKETRAIRDLVEKMDCPEIEDREDRPGLRERRATRARSVPRCLRISATPWLCRESPAPKASRAHQASEREDRRGLKEQTERRDRRGRREQQVSKEKRESPAPCAPLWESYPQTWSQASCLKPNSRRARKETLASD